MRFCAAPFCRNKTDSQRLARRRLLSEAGASQNLFSFYPYYDIFFLPYSYSEHERSTVMKHPAKVLSFLLAAALLLGLSCSASAESVASAKASAMRLMKADGSVSLTDRSEVTLSVREGMRLYSGNTLSTAENSRAGILLDDAKAVTLSELSRASLQAEGKKLALNLEHGAMFFSVTKPLEADESFTIQTSTMMLGIRGTSGYVETVSDFESAVTLTSGKVVLSFPGGGELPVSPGMRVVVHTDASGPQVSFVPASLDDFAGLASDTANLLDNGVPEPVAESSSADLSLSQLREAAQEELFINRNVRITDDYYNLAAGASVPNTSASWADFVAGIYSQSGSSAATYAEVSSEHVSLDQYDIIYYDEAGKEITGDLSNYEISYEAIQDLMPPDTTPDSTGYTTVGNNRYYTETYITYDEEGNRLVSTYTYTDESKREMKGIERDKYEVIRTPIEKAYSNPYEAIQVAVDTANAAVDSAYSAAIGNAYSAAVASAFSSLFG